MFLDALTQDVMVMHVPEPRYQRRLSTVSEHKRNSFVRYLASKLPLGPAKRIYFHSELINQQYDAVLPSNDEEGEQIWYAPPPVSIADIPWLDQYKGELGVWLRTQIRPSSRRNKFISAHKKGGAANTASREVLQVKVCCCKGSNSDLSTLSESGYATPRSSGRQTPVSHCSSMVSTGCNSPERVNTSDPNGTNKIETLQQELLMLRQQVAVLVLAQEQQKQESTPIAAPPPPPPPPPPGAPPPPPPPGMGGAGGNKSGGGTFGTVTIPGKTKKTVRLHWREARNEYPLPSGRMSDTIWNKIATREGRCIQIDKDKLEHLFETRQVEVKQKKEKQEGSKKEIVVLDPKRSNAINIGLTKLPPTRAIKTAIIKMDTSILNRDGIEKIMSLMLPSDEEKTKIMEAQMANPDIPLGTAEQFLLMLSGITELYARLSLWAFKLDYEGVENEIAEPLMDLKQGIEDMRSNRTLKSILGMLLEIGNFLNNANMKAFSLEYLCKVPEVKDTVHKQSLLYHVCGFVIDQFPDSTDLYSELGAIARLSKVDWDELHMKLSKLESDCKKSWDHLRAIVKHETSSQFKNKLSDFLTDCAERIIVLKLVYKRVMNRFFKFLLFLGYTATGAKDVKVTTFCKTVTEFSLEYRTWFEKVKQQRVKKANAKERKKTRGKMIIDKEPEPVRRSGWRDPDEVKQQKLNSVLHNGSSDIKAMSLPGARTRKRASQDYGKGGSRHNLSAPGRGGHGTDTDSHYDTADDDMLDAAVKSASMPTNNRMRNRRRAQNKERKSLRRTLKSGLNSEEIAAIYNEEQKV